MSFEIFSLQLPLSLGHGGFRTSSANLITTAGLESEVEAVLVSVFCKEDLYFFFLLKVHPHCISDQRWFRILWGPRGSGRVNGELTLPSPPTPNPCRPLQQPIVFLLQDVAGSLSC